MFKHIYKSISDGVAFFFSAAGASPYGLTPSSQGSGNIMSPPPPPGSSQDGWSMNGDYGSQVSDMHTCTHFTTVLFLRPTLIHLYSL